MPQHPSVGSMPRQHIALDPEFQSPAVARCCNAWNRAFKAYTEAGCSPVFITVRANEAYRNAMPPLSSPQNLSDFVACVAHGVTVRAICLAHATPLLAAAKVASSVFRLVENSPDKPAPHSAPEKNEISGCETVDWDFAAVKTTTYPEQPSSEQPQNEAKSA